MRIFAAAFLVSVLAFPVHAQQDKVAAHAAIGAIENLLKQRPTDATLYFYLARSHAQLGEKAAVVAALEKVLELGDGFLPARQEGFDPVWGDAAFQAVYAKLEAKLPRLDFAPTAFEMIDKTVIPEGIAYDAPSRSFFVGSIAQGRIYRVDDARGITEFAGAGANFDHVLGLAVDSPRRLLYAVTTSALTTEGEKRRRNAIVAFDIDTRKLMKRYDVDTAQQLNDVTVAAGGRVFASDSASGAIFEIGIQGPGPAARELVRPNQLRGSNGIAASPDGKKLYVAHSTGIAVVETDTGAVRQVVNDTRENVAAIDGLYQHQGELIGVQNVTSPGRVIEISLGRGGESIARVRTLLSHHHTALDEPTTGAVAGDYFYLLAATGVSHFNREGRIERLETLHSPTVLKVLLAR
ncbi:MAG: SMP-30/gluconolactonase/LRE family protein [Usitatibacter sp.]